MNYLIVKSIIGRVLYFEAAFMLLPCFTALIYQEYSGWSFVFTALLCVLVGAVLTRKKTKNTVFYVKEGFVSVALSWIVLSFMGGLPFLFSGVISNPIDALFETVSGFTTTGASILKDVEVLPHCMLMWRSFTHWIGGMGILVFILAILPMAGDYNMHIMRAESPGPSVGKLVPKIRITAKLLYSIYFCMTIVMMILLLLGKMPLFDSICMSFGAAGTGGFACRNSGQADYTVYQQAVITIFMLLFGVNFNVYYLLLIRRPKDAGRCEELRGYLAVVAIAILLITINIRSLFPSLFMAFHQAAFQVSSIITTTGYSTIDYNSWPEFSKTILLLIMFIGACAGSTGGGMKVSRVMIAFKEIKKEMASVIHPRSVKVLKFEGKPLEHNTLRSLNAYIIVYFMIFGISTLIVSLDNYDFMTSFSAVAANLNNIGPGMSVVGPASNYSMMSYLSKTVLIFDMLAGRLELFPMLVLLSPGTWKRS